MTPIPTMTTLVLENSNLTQIQHYTGNMLLSVHIVYLQVREIIKERSQQVKLTCMQECYHHLRLVI